MEIARNQLALGQPKNFLTEGAQFMGNSYAGTHFGQKLADVAGPPPALDPSGYARADVSLYTTPDAYHGKFLDFLATTLDVMLQMLPTFPSLLVPLYPTEDLAIRITQHQHNSGIAERVPDLGLPRVLQQGRTEYQYRLVPYAKAIHIFTGFWATEEGRAHFARAQVMLRQCFQLAMDTQRFEAIFNAPVYNMYKDALYTNNGIKYQNLNGVFEKQRRIFASLHSSGGFNYIIHQMKGVFEYNIRPNAILIPPGAATLVTLADPHETNYYTKGAGSETVLRLGKDYVAEWDGMTVYEVPTYWVDERRTVENFSTRTVQIGDAFQIRDFFTGLPGYTTRRTRTNIYDMDSDNGRFQPFDITSVTNHSATFDLDGKYSDEIQDFVAALNKGEVQPNEKKFEHYVHPAIRRDDSGRYSLINVIGEMELPYLSATAVHNIVAGFAKQAELADDLALKTSISAGLGLMNELSTPNLNTRAAQIYFDAVQTAVGTASGIVGANRFGTLDLAAVANAIPGAASIDAMKPWGYGTWAGIQTLADNQQGIGGIAGPNPTAVEFVAAVRTLAQKLARVFPDNRSFDPRYCPFFLRTPGDDARMCTFVHALLATQVSPVFVKAGAGAVPVIGGDAWGANNVGAYRQAAYVLNTDPIWNTANTEAKLAASFENRGAQWREFTSTSTTANATSAFINQYISAGETLRTDAQNNPAPTIQLLYNVLRYNNGDLELPAGKTAIDADVIRLWRDSGDAQYSVFNATGVNPGIRSATLAADLDAVAKGTFGEWVNTRLFVDGSSFRTIDPAQLPRVAIRPASPIFPAIPYATGNDAEAAMQLRLLGSELDLSLNPVANLLSVNDTRLTLIERLELLNESDLKAEIQRLRSSLGAPRFGVTDSMTVRWNGVRELVGDGIERAIAIMYLMQPFNKKTMDSFAATNMPLPYEGVGVRPRRRYVTGSMVMCRGGSDFAILAYGHPRSLASNSTNGVWTFQYSMYMAAVVKDTSRMLLAPDVCTLKYCNGEGVKIAEVGSQLGGDVYMLMVPYGSARGKNLEADALSVQYPIDLTGYYRPEYLSQKIHPDALGTIDWLRPTYPTQLFYNRVWKFNKTPVADIYNNSQFGINRGTEHRNTLCFQTFQFVATDPTAQTLDGRIRNDGHFLDTIPINSKDLRQLPAKAMLPETPADAKWYME